MLGRIVVYRLTDINVLLAVCMKQTGAADELCSNAAGDFRGLM